MGFLDGLAGIGKALVGGVTSAVGGLPGMALGFLGDSMQNNTGVENAERAYQQSKEATALAYKNSVDSYKHRYQWSMDDMKAAGLNPILAAGSGGFNVGGSPQMAPASSFLPSSPYMSSSSSAKNFSESGAQLEETSKKKEETKLVINQAAHELKKIEVTMKQKDLITTQNRKAWEEIFVLAQEFCKKGAEIDKIREEITFVQKNTEATQADTERIRATKENLKKSTSLLEAQARQLAALLSEQRKIAEIYDGPAGSVLAFIKEVLGALRLNIGVVGGLPSKTPKPSKFIDRGGR